MMILRALVVPIIFLLAAGPALAARQVPQGRAEVQLSYAPLVAKTAPAVVNIYTKKVIRSSFRSPLFDDPFFQRFFGRDFLGGGLSRERVQRSLGSGVIVRADGIIITNNHVIDGADEIVVALADRREFPAKLVLADKRTDLAVLRIDVGDEKLPILELADSDKVLVGDLVLAIGDPFGVGQTVTSGIVSALGRSQGGVSDYQFFIQTDAAINPGNSGGALIGLDGRLIGVNTAILSRSGGSIGVGFAIPANIVGFIIDSALNGGKVVRPWLGAGGQAVTAEIAASLGLDRPVGVLVNGVYPGGPADQAGLKVGDVVLAVNDHEISDPQGLLSRLGSQRVGGQAALTVLHAGKRRTLMVDLKPPPEVPPRNETELTGRHPLAGAVALNLSPAVAEELGVDSMMRGVMIFKVARRSPAARFGIQPGDVMVSVNGQKIATVSQLEDVLENAPGGWSIKIRRNGQLLSLTIRR
jgi:serine protease Do